MALSPPPGSGVAAATLPLFPPARRPEELHPALWRAHQLGRVQAVVLASGFAELDAQLPGGGWPAGVLTELLLPHAGVGELRLLAPVLARQQGAQHSLMWFDPPAAPCAWALAALGIAVRQLVVVHSRQMLKSRGPQRPQAAPPPLPEWDVQAPGGRARAREQLPAADILWALEHALKSGHLGAVLAWLPARLPADALRRLQLAAQAHAGPAFLLRGVQARSQPSAAPLRLLLASAGPDALQVTLLKRRGPPLAQPITLALPPVLSAPARARALAGRVAPVAALPAPRTATAA